MVILTRQPRWGVTHFIPLHHPVAPPPAEPPEDHDHPSLGQRLARNLHPPFRLHVLDYEVEVVPVQMHAFGDVIAQPMMLPLFAHADAVPGLVPPVDGVLEVRGHEVAVEGRARGLVDASEVRGAGDPMLEGPGQEVGGAVVDLLVGEDFVFPFGELVHHGVVHVPDGEDHARDGASGGDGELGAGDEVVEAVAEDDEAFLVGEEAGGVFGREGETGDGALGIVAAEHGAGEGNDVGEAEEGFGCEGRVAVVSDPFGGDPGRVEGVHGMVDVRRGANVVVRELELGIAGQDSEEEFVDERGLDVEGVGDCMFDGRLWGVLEGVGGRELETKGVAVAFGEEDTLFGTEDGPCHAMAKSSASKLAKVGGSKGGFLLGEGDCGICRHGGVDGRAFGPQGQMVGSGHVL